MSEPSPPSSRSALSPALALARRVLAPVEAFLAIEASSGIVLLVAAAVALGWANSPWREDQVALWATPLRLAFGRFSFERDLLFWLNDGLMTVFFFVVGLEIRRELHHGELSEPRRAALPLAAALGGMVTPALLFLAFNGGTPSVHGWGTPMATDIAFAVGVLALLGARVPAALRILLLALAVIDDIGAIVVIALFYGAGFHPMGLVVAAAGAALFVAVRRVGERHPLVLAVPTLVMWVGLHEAGVHPTLAGVVAGLLTSMEGPFGVERLTQLLHGAVAYVIMPLFALANAGVPLGAATFDAEGWRVFLGVAVGLLVGKPVGILAFCWLTVRLGWAALPRGVGWLKVLVVGLTAGIGFTMAIFVAHLAFPAGPRLETAKLAILAGSTLAGVVSWLAGRAILPAVVEAGAATSASEAEASTDR